MFNTDLPIFETVFIIKLSTSNHLRTLELLRSTKRRMQYKTCSLCRAAPFPPSIPGTPPRVWNTINDGATQTSLSPIFFLFFAGRAGCTQTIKRHFALIYAFLLCIVIILDRVNHSISCAVGMRENTTWNGLDLCLNITSESKNIKTI